MENRIKISFHGWRYSYETAPYCGHYYDGYSKYFGLVSGDYHESEGVTRYGFRSLPHLCIYTTGTRSLNVGTILTPRLKRFRKELKAISLYLRLKGCNYKTARQAFNLYR